MSESTVPSPSILIQTFKFPFSEKSWIQKVLIIFLLMVANFIIPLIPSIFIAGYYYRICRRIIAEDGQAVLPEWDDWSRLLVDGIKYVGASIIYCIPLLISFLLMYLVAFLPMFGSILPMDTWNGNGAPPVMIGSMLLMFLMYPSVRDGNLLPHDSISIVCPGISNGCGKTAHTIRNFDCPLQKWICRDKEDQIDCNPPEKKTHSQIK